MNLLNSVLQKYPEFVKLGIPEIPLFHEKHPLYEPYHEKFFIESNQLSNLIGIK